MGSIEMDPATGYYYPPYSLSSLAPHVRAGILVIGSLACLSIIVTVSTLGLILHRYIIWRQHVEKTSSYNQCVSLLSNLLLADLIQAISFSISFHWYQVNGVLAPTNYCYTQAGFLQFGNVSSGSFVFAIAIHTCYTVIKKKSISQKIFIRVVAFVWIFAFIMTVAGPIAHGGDFFARAGNWCWISEKYNLARLLLHYMWIFAFEFSTIIIYSSLFFYLWRSSRLASSQSVLATRNPQLLKAARYMIAYPVVYLVGTLPIATGRMMIMSGKMPSDRYLLFAGAMLTSCGWVDGLLYTVTRNVFRDSDSDRYRNVSGSSSSHPGAGGDPSRNPSEVSTANAPVRPKLTEWMRTVSATSVRQPLCRGQSFSGSNRVDRLPSDASGWEIGSIGPATGRNSRKHSDALSFSEFLTGHDQEAAILGGKGAGGGGLLSVLPVSNKKRTLSFAEFMAGHEEQEQVGFGGKGNTFGFSGGSPFALPPSTKKRNLSFVEFLAGHDDTEAQQDEELQTIPESPITHRSIVR